MEILDAKNSTDIFTNYGDNLVARGFKAKLEYKVITKALDAHLEPNSKILDLGGRSGKYAAFLSRKGHSITLIESNEEALNNAKKNIELLGGSVQDIIIGNVQDLSSFNIGEFDAVLALDHFYRLPEKHERVQATQEIKRVSKRGAFIFALFIPKMSGLSYFIKQASEAPELYSSDMLLSAMETGVLEKPTNTGSTPIFFRDKLNFETLFSSNGYKRVVTKSILGIANGKEEKLEQIYDSNPALFHKIWEIIEKTAAVSEIIPTGGKAVYIGKT